MNVLYDHQIFTLQRYGGISRYFCELMDRFSQNPDIKFSIGLRASYNENLCNRHLLNPYWSNRSKLLSGTQIIPYAQNTLHINFMKRLNYFNKPESVRLIKRQDFDIFHPTYYHHYFLEHLQGKPYVLTVHDMIHELYPDYFSSNDPAVQWKKELIDHASAIIAVSEKTKSDILKITNVDPDRITVIYHGNPFESANHLRETQKLSSLPPVSEKSYLLFVGPRILYKNFIFFIESISGLLLQENDLHLCCAGGGAFTSEEKEMLRKLGICSKVHYIEPSEQILLQLYENALAFVFPSRYEGFGLPILEAFSCGCPVISSNTGSLPEIGGNSVAYFNPDDMQSITKAVENVLSDPGIQKYLIMKGYERLKDFSWRKTAAKTKRVYENVLNQT